MLLLFTRTGRSSQLEAEVQTLQMEQYTVNFESVIKLHEREGVAEQHCYETSGASRRYDRKRK
jgi:hypothetical protein